MSSYTVVFTVFLLLLSVTAARSTETSTPTCTAEPTPTPTPTVPDAVTVAVTVDQSNMATFTWTAPNDNGSPITGYTLTLNNGTSWTISRHYSSSELSDSVQFSPAVVSSVRTATVVATNAIGDSPSDKPTTFHIGCNPGRKDTNGQCVTCSAGQYESQGKCINCAMGTSTNHMRGVTECPTCPEGYFSKSVGAYECSACPPGSTSNDAATGCDLCPVGTYSWQYGSANCLPCPSGTETGANTCLEDIDAQQNATPQ
eukprot:TRINITY_DN3350_c0_g1_i3.p1 TRINITY_DN3350_c0_g1~~TRINITY_DN3350_c0_g1_i3.p1  ORF type:complete len:257 (-),score=63.47 TRINITY_DN3350_c0_g1_i3:79-849(-)